MYHIVQRHWVWMELNLVKQLVLVMFEKLTPIIFREIVRHF